jgi:nitrogen fixation NifU-like protein
MPSVNDAAGLHASIRTDVMPLYSPTVIERFRRPRFRGTVPGATAVAEGFNPLCGDRIRVEIDVHDGRIRTCRHRGDACALCLAAADMLAELVQGHTCEEARAVSVDDICGRLAADVAPSRLACVGLPVTTLAEAIARGEVREEGA